MKFYNSTTSTRIDNETLDRAREISEVTGIPITKIIKEAVDLFYAEFAESNHNKYRVFLVGADTVTVVNVDTGKVEHEYDIAMLDDLRRKYPNHKLFHAVK